MAEPDIGKVGGLANVGIDMAKLPLYDQSEDRLKELNDAQREAIDSLERRYEKPNWFKVAAGFAKPQLGGFLASLGSASEAMGENVEQQRATQLPVAQMKLQLAQSNMLLGANKKVADQVKVWRDANPGKTPSAQQVGEWAALAPGSNVVESLKNELTYQQAQQGQTLERIRQKAEFNIPLTDEDKAFLTQLPEGQPRNKTTTPAGGVNQQTATPQSEEKKTTPPANQPPANPDKAASAPYLNDNSTTVSEEKKPTSSEEKKTTPVEAKAKQIYILPNGARVGEDVYTDFYNNGKSSIPIISHLRTQAEQDALKDHQDKNGQWLTKEGRPVADSGKHITGDAMDLDPKVKLNSAQIKTLNDKGWNQTNPKGDPNHWERNSKVATEKIATPSPVASQSPAPANNLANQVKNYPPTLSLPDTSGMGNQDRELIMANHTKSIAATEAPNVDMIKNYQSVVTGTNYTTTKSTYDAAIAMMERNPIMAQQVFALLRKSGLEAAVNAGIGFHAGNLTANVSLPIEAFKDADRPEAVKAYADALFQKLGVLAMANVKASGGSLSGTPQQEYMNALHAFANKDMTSISALHSLNLSRAGFEHKKEIYDQVMKELPHMNTSKTQTPYTDILRNSPVLKRIDSKHLLIQNKYNNEYEQRIRSATNKRQENKP